MNREEAIGLVQESGRRDHSILVSKIMVVLAQHHDADPVEWELAGILHDLDYDVTVDRRDKHGILTSERLSGKISDNILNAIRSHDHRTGIKPTSLLDRSLIYADAVSVVIDETDSVLNEKPWIRKIIDDYDLPSDLSLDNLIKLVSC